MNFKNFQIAKHRSLYINIALSICFAFLLLFLRIKITGDSFYIFLVWNLFLAGIPFAITQLFQVNKKLRSHRFTPAIAFCIWLLFLPNSPYIITDLVHLQNELSSMVWLDLFLVFVFAFNGLLLGLLSMLDMFALIREQYGKRIATYTLFCVCLLCGYGIYLGRFLRFNSWDITTKPLTLFTKILQSFQEPKVWLITFAFGGFLWILFSILQSVLKIKQAFLRR